MISINIGGKFNVTGTNACEIYGLSTDTKPTDDSIKNGYAFIEMDTGKLYFYDEAGTQWLPWGA